MSRGGGKVRALLIMDIQKGYFEEYDTDLLNKINQRILQAIENQEQIIYVKNIKKLRSAIDAQQLGYKVILPCASIDIKNKEQFVKTKRVSWKKIELEMKHLNRRPAVYITSNQENLELEKSIRESHLENLYTDVWMVLQNRKKLSRQTSGIQENVQIQEVGEILKEKYIQAIMEGFSGDDPNDPYESLSPSYRVALERSFSSKKKVAPKVIHFLARIGEEPVATATVIYSGTKAILYNITTKKAYQRKGICKKMMNWIVEDLWNRGITNIALQTEEGFYTQTVYQNLGFEEILLGKAYAKRQS